jgi:TniQ
MMDPQELSFPFQDSIRPCESGQGYALRMAQENGLHGLPPLKMWLGKSRFAALDAADAPMLHRWFGANETLLEFALGHTATGRRDHGYSYAGQSMGRSYFLNRAYPRVCPECLAADEHCVIPWDISLVVVCARHRRALIDRCHYCLSALSWNRSRLGACGCGVELAMSDSPQEVMPIEVQFAAWVDGRVARSSEQMRSSSQSVAVVPARPVGLTALMTLLWPLSLNGGLHVAYALGTAADYDDQRQILARREKTPIKKAQQVLVQANELAEKIVRQEPVKFRISRPSVVVQLLAESATVQNGSADQSLAQSILVAVLRYQKRATWSSLNPNLSQLPLF